MCPPVAETLVGRDAHREILQALGRRPPPGCGLPGGGGGGARSVTLARGWFGGRSAGATRRSRRRCPGPRGGRSSCRS